jgi:hypothetical protein
MVSTSLVEFVLARIAEDEMVATRAIDHHPIGHHWDERDSEDAEHFARWNPWRILNLCTIRRRILSAHKSVTAPTGEVECAACHGRTGQANWPCDTIRLLVLDWVEHPDFREYWVR